MMNLDEVRMWVFEETLPNGEKLTEVINKTNVKTPFTIVLLYMLQLKILISWFINLIVKF